MQTFFKTAKAMPHPIKKFSDSATLTAELANRIGHLLAEATATRGRASLAVSGGSTPIPLFERLVHLDIPWEQVVITLVDERWVEPTSTDSNEHLVRTHLLQDRAARATFIGLKNQAPCARDGETGCEEHQKLVPRPFDVLVLGMGSDGHTASLFPGADTLAAATDMLSGRRCIAVTPVAAAHERMTLTLPAILDSYQIFLHITGWDKYRVLEKALANGPAEEMPIRYILRQNQTPVTIYWAP
ncbi:6-phosphogluconolactonase [Desulfolithobacter sp.]